MIKAIAAACLVVGAVALAPVVHADEDGYLAELSQHGIFTFKNPQGLIATGHAICDDLAHGASIQDEMNKIQIARPGATPQGVAAMVNSAKDQLCP